MEELVSINPCDGREVGRVPVTDPSDLPGIIEESRKTQMVWSHTSDDVRAGLFHNLVKTLLDNADHISSTVVSETGKPPAEGYATEVLAAVAMADYCPTWIGAKHEKTRGKMSGALSFTGRSTRIAREPLGVVAIISPFNFPFSIPFTQAAMAIAAGNSVVLKPSSDTPLTGDLVASMFEDAGFPKGLVRVVHGPGVGGALASSKIDKVFFTGGPGTGKSVMAAASANLVPCVLELGGNDAMVVLDDADLDRALDCALWGSFVNAGQVCAGIQRIFVHDSIYETFSERLSTMADGLRQGDGSKDPGVSIGPVINDRALGDVLAALKDLEASGGRFTAGGGVHPDLGGRYVMPTVVQGVPVDSPAAKNEIFGPVVILFPFSDAMDAIAMANSTEYSLTASVWTSDPKKGAEMAAHLRAGSVCVNNATYTYGIPETVWSGRGLSGFGATHGPDGFREMTVPKVIHSDSGKYRDPWWMPYGDDTVSVQREMGESLFSRKRPRLLRLYTRVMPSMRRK